MSDGIFRVADICFRFRLKVLTLILLALHAGFMIGLGVCVLKGDTSYTNIGKEGWPQLEVNILAKCLFSIDLLSLLNSKCAQISANMFF